MKKLGRGSKHKTRNENEFGVLNKIVRQNSEIQTSEGNHFQCTVVNPTKEPV